MTKPTQTEVTSKNTRPALAIGFSIASIVIPFVLQLVSSVAYNQTHGSEYASGWGFGVFFTMVFMVVFLGWPLAITGLTLGIISLKKNVNQKNLAVAAIVIASIAIVLLPVLVLSASALVGQPGSNY